MATLLKGAAAAAALNERTAAVIEGLKAKGITPALGILRVGERPDDLSYERGAVKRDCSQKVPASGGCFPGKADGNDKRHQ